MFSILVKVLLIATVAILDSFISSLIPPLHLISVIPITIMLLFLFKGLDAGFIPTTFILGVINSYTHFEPVAVVTILYFIAFFIIYTLRNTLITHQNITSAFLLSLIFYLIIAIGQNVIKLHFSFLLLQEIIFSVFFNAFLTFAIFMIISAIKKQLEKRFLFSIKLKRQI